jgi:hypothetical protein
MATASAVGRHLVANGSCENCQKREKAAPEIDDS